MKRLHLDLRTGKDLLFLDCVYTPQSLPWKRLVASAKPMCSLDKVLNHGLTGLRGRPYKSLAHAMQSTTPPPGLD